jgi:hypothetical protein
MQKVYENGGKVFAKYLQHIYPPATASAGCAARGLQRSRCVPRLTVFIPSATIPRKPMKQKVGIITRRHNSPQ